MPGLVDFCLPGFTEIAKPLYETTRAQEDKIEWTSEIDITFKSLSGTYGLDGRREEGRQS